MNYILVIIFIIIILIIVLLLKISIKYGGGEVEEKIVKEIIPTAYDIQAHNFNVEYNDIINFGNKYDTVRTEIEFYDMCFIDGNMYIGAEIKLNVVGKDYKKLYVKYNLDGTIYNVEAHPEIDINEPNKGIKLKNIDNIYSDYYNVLYTTIQLYNKLKFTETNKKNKIYNIEKFYNIIHRFIIVNSFVIKNFRLNELLDENNNYIFHAKNYQPLSFELLYDIDTENAHANADANENENEKYTLKIKLINEKDKLPIFIMNTTESVSNISTHNVFQIIQDAFDVVPHFTFVKIQYEFNRLSSITGMFLLELYE